MIGKTWYSSEGSKAREFWTILHLPYTLMALSFLAIGFGIGGVRDWNAFLLTAAAYFLGLGIAAHCFDQIEGMGSRYVKILTDGDLIITGAVALVGAVAIGTYLIASRGLSHLLWIIPLQVFFVFSYPLAKWFKGAFHTDFWFAVSFGVIPVLAGSYINSSSFDNPIPLALWAAVTFLVALIEITLSRYVRQMRKEQVDTRFRVKPELALQLLCFLSYTLAIVVVVVNL